MKNIQSVEEILSEIPEEEIALFDACVISIGSFSRNTYHCRNLDDIPYKNLEDVARTLEYVLRIFRHPQVFVTRNCFEETERTVGILEERLTFYKRKTSINHDRNRKALRERPQRIKSPRREARFALKIRGNPYDDDSLYTPPPKIARNNENEYLPSIKHPKLEFYEKIIDMLRESVEVASGRILKSDNNRYSILFDLVDFIRSQFVRERPYRKGEQEPKSYRSLHQPLFGDTSLVATAFNQAMEGMPSNVFTQDRGVLALLDRSYKLFASDDLWPWNSELANALKSNRITLYCINPGEYTVCKTIEDFRKGEFYFLDPRTNKDDRIREFVLDNMRRFYFARVFNDSKDSFLLL